MGGGDVENTGAAACGWIAPGEGNISADGATATGLDDGTVAVSTGSSAGAPWPGHPTTGIGSGPAATRVPAGTVIVIGT
jgi:hypothetical protein